MRRKLNEENYNQVIELGTCSDLDKVSDRFKWEAIKNNPFIAPDYYAKGSDGFSLINGDTRPYGVKELYNKDHRRKAAWSDGRNRAGYERKPDNTRRQARRCDNTRSYRRSDKRIRHIC